MALEVKSAWRASIIGEKPRRKVPYDRSPMDSPSRKGPRAPGELPRESVSTSPPKLNAVGLSLWRKKFTDNSPEESESRRSVAIGGGAATLP